MLCTFVQVKLTINLSSCLPVEVWISGSSHMKNPFVQPSALLHVYGRSSNTAHMKILFCRTASWPRCTWSCAIWCIELDAGFHRLPYHITKQQQKSASAWCYNLKSPYIVRLLLSLSEECRWRGILKQNRRHFMSHTPNNVILCY
jgi:hypothetical protein